MFGKVAEKPADVAETLSDDIRNRPSGKSLRLNPDRSTGYADEDWITSVQNQEIAWLDMSQVKIDSGILVKIISSINFETLLHLDLRNTKFGDSECNTLKGVINQCKFLADLILAHTPVTNTGFELLAEGLENSSVTHLDIEGIQIADLDRFAKQLGSIKTLTSFKSSFELPGLLREGLVEHRKHRDQFLLACQNSRMQDAEKLLKDRLVSIYTRNDQGDNALHIATKARLLSVITFLFENGIRDRLPGCEEYLAIDVAHEQNNLDVAVLILHEGKISRRDASRIADGIYSQRRAYMDSQLRVIAELKEKNAELQKTLAELEAQQEKSKNFPN